MTVEKMTQEQLDHLILLLALFPSLPVKEVEVWFNAVHPGVINVGKIYKTRSNHRKRILELQQNPKKLQEQANLLGFTSLHNKLARIYLLERLAFKCINGYQAESQDPSGGINIYTKYDHKTGLEAIKAIKEEIGDEVLIEPNYNINIVPATLPPKPEPLPGDEEL